MNIKSYRVTCNKCKKSEVVPIDSQRNIYWKQVKYIISGRYRLDMQWGWQCMCGNNDLVTKQEQTEIKNLQAPDPKDISRVLESIIPDVPQFKMQEMM